jgi:hypothetical protein
MHPFLIAAAVLVLIWMILEVYYCMYDRSAARKKREAPTPGTSSTMGWALWLAMVALVGVAMLPSTPYHLRFLTNLVWAQSRPKMARQFSYSFPSYGHYDGQAWPAIERRSIATLTSDAFKQEFVQTRTPVILTGFNHSGFEPAPLLLWNMDKMKDDEQCEKWAFDLRNHYYQGLKTLKHDEWVWPVLGRIFNSRVAATHGENFTMDEVMKQMERRWTIGEFIRTLNDTTAAFDKVSGLQLQPVQTVF